jgi:hypothetical protein
MRTWNWYAAPLIVAAITVLAAGCASGSGTAALTSLSRPEEPDVVVAALPAADLAGLYIAQDDGFFAKQGLHVKIEKIASSAAVIADQEQGEVDITAGSYVAYIAAQAAGARFHILAGASALRPDTRVLVVPANSPIKSLAELVGKKIVRPAQHAIYRRSSAGNSGQIDDQPRLLSLLARGPATRDQLRGTSYAGPATRGRGPAGCRDVADGGAGTPRTWRAWP